MKSLFRLFALGLLLALAGCTTIPLSTMWKMHSFGAEDFARIKPEELRVKMLLPQGFELDFVKDKPHLDFKIETAHGASVGKIELAKVSQQQITKTSGLFNPTTTTQTEYELKLTDESLPAFNLLQKIARGQEKGRSTTINIGFNFAKTPKGNPDLTVTVSLLLFPQDGYFVLLDNAQLKQVPEEKK